MPHHSNPIDSLRPDAPALARPGPHGVGVRQMLFAHADQPCLQGPYPETLTRETRRLLVEIWYPAAPGDEARAQYHTQLRDGRIPTTLTGRAQRDVPPRQGLRPCPLVILSHGYPGNRFLLAHFGESLASRGYVVASIGHKGSLYTDYGTFSDTLVNRPSDQRFVLDQLYALWRAAPDLSAILAPDRAALIGFSMGGYGALICGGAGLSRAAMDSDLAPRDDLLARYLAGSDSHGALQDDRLRAVIALGPWGMNRGFWDDAGLAAMRTPLMLMAGSLDEVSGYAAMRRIFAGTTGTDRHLVTFVNAGHNAAAPIPAPHEAWSAPPSPDVIPFAHYADPVWDSVRMNNIAQHYATAFLDLHLQQDAGAAQFLTQEGWPGFAPDSHAGLRFESLARGQRGIETP